MGRREHYKRFAYTARKQSTFANTEEEADGEQSSLIVDQSLDNGNAPPDESQEGQPILGIGLLEYELRGHFE